MGKTGMPAPRWEALVERKPDAGIQQVFWDWNVLATEDRPTPSSITNDALSSPLAVAGVNRSFIVRSANSGGGVCISRVVPSLKPDK